MDENAAFHLAIFEASGNGQLSGLARQLQLPLIMLQVRRNLPPEVLARSVAEHRRIAEGHPRRRTAAPPRTRCARIWPAPRRSPPNSTRRADRDAPQAEERADDLSFAT